VRVLLLTPPLTQLNTPYPATTYLTGHLRSRGYDVRQADVSLLFFLRLFAPEALREAARLLRAAPASRSNPAATYFLGHTDAIVSSAPLALSLLQGRDLSMAVRVAARRALPEGPRFSKIGPAGHEAEYLAFAFGTLGTLDRARYFASLFINDVADALAVLDPHFQLGRYGERIAASQPSFEPLARAIMDDEVLTARVLDSLVRELCETHEPDVVGLTVPFPGNVLGALRIGKTVRRVRPRARIVWGGGYVNTELRELSDPRVFDFVDAITYDDGERPLECLLEHYAGRRARDGLLRTRMRDDKGRVISYSSASEHDVPMRDTGRPTLDGLSLDAYVGILDLLNPMHRLWNDTRWNKLTVAHGCYWKKCTFCDVTLPYIADYEPAAASELVDRIEALVAESGTRGFHFVDEAAPPKALEAMAREILRRNLGISWWGNIRFEKTFTRERCELLARSGCIAVTGGLEVASNRLLDLMEKGVTVEQVARVSKAFADAGVLVHAYLMYGFPTQTLAETIDSLERVRQLFAAGCIDSAYWHRFSATAHAPIGREPERFGIRLLPAPPATFARNDLAFEDPTGCDHAALGPGLQKAVYNYMHGLGLEEDVRVWFDLPVPKARVPPGFIERALRGEDAPRVRTSAPRTATEKRHKRLPIVRR
jgi:radical SAM superfamily enzyme YgiQ (UPF0313 family)